MTTRELLEKTKAAWPSVRSAGADDKNRLLLSMAEHLMHHADEILFANAQDVEQALAACGLTGQDFAAFVRSPREGGGADYGLRYEELVALCIRQIQRLQARVERLEG